MLWDALAEDDRVHVGDTSAPDGSKDRTMTRADARRALQCEVISQTAHGLSALDCVRHNGTSYVEATADTAVNAIVAGVVVSVPGVDTFIVQYGGDVVDQAGLTAGSVHYLQDAGGLGTAEGTIVRPVLVALSATEGIILTIGSGGGSGGGGSYDMLLGFTGPISASVLDWILVGRACFIDNTAPGEAFARTLPSADWTADIQKNGTGVGTVTISSAGVVTWSIASDISLAAGDRIELVAPDPADGTIEDVQVAFRALVT